MTRERGNGRIREESQQRLFQRVCEFLESCEISAPNAQEVETAYTKRVLLPAITAHLEARGLGKLIVVGETSAAPPVDFWGKVFYPDIAILYYGERLVAIEVKLMRSGQSVATALGQALIYRAAGYRHSCAFLVGNERDARSSVTAGLENLEEPHTIVRTACQGVLTARNG